MHSREIKYVLVAVLAGALCLNIAPAGAQTLVEAAKLLADDGSASDQFGVSVAVSGETAVIGSHIGA